jgi:hypothetical protein
MKKRNPGGFMDCAPRIADSYVPTGLESMTWNAGRVHGYSFGGFWILRGLDAKDWTVLGGGGGQLIGNADSLPFAVAMAGWLITSRTAGRDS